MCGRTIASILALSASCALAACPAPRSSEIDAQPTDAGDDRAPAAGGDAGSSMDAAGPFTNRGPNVAAPDPTGKFLYVGDRATKTISQFAINADGTLSPLSPATISVGLVPYTIRANPVAASRKLYVGATDDNNGAVYQFDIGVDGNLTPLSPSTPPSTAQPIELVMDPMGRYVFAIDHNVGIRHFRINADGTLTQNGADLITGNQTFAGTVSPDGTKVYAIAGGLTWFDVGPGGRLTSFGSTPGFGAGLLMHPSGSFVYLNVQNGLAVYRITADGSLTPLGGEMRFAAFSWKSAITPDGRHLYAVGLGGGDNMVFQFAVAMDGSLMPLTPPSVSSGTATSNLTISPDGKFLYVPNATDGTISQYRINADGTLSPLAPPTVPG